MGLLDGKIAIITGSTRGIGAATARLLSKEGAVSIVTGRTEDAGKKVAQEIVSSGAKAEYYNFDVTNEQNVKDVIDSVYNKYGSIDILVNNAGILGPDKPTHEFTKEEWDSVFRVNVTGPFLCTKYVVPYMKKEKGGNIVYISSIYGIVGAPDVPAYHATKAAIRIMAKIDALMYTKDNIRVNSIHPGYIGTSMVDNFIEKQSRKTGESIDDIKKNLGSMQPIGHIGEPIDIAYGVLYLVSKESRFVIGSELVIDGGYTAT
jgi:NAD(P)-dependent dehydrogenase (short-subunit alcohol dehydrogenase family)